MFHNKLREISNFGFREGDRFYAGIMKYGVQWVKRQTNVRSLLTRHHLNQLLIFF